MSRFSPETRDLAHLDSLKQARREEVGPAAWRRLSRNDPAPSRCSALNFNGRLQRKDGSGKRCRKDALIQFLRDRGRVHLLAEKVGIVLTGNEGFLLHDPAM